MFFDPIYFLFLAPAMILSFAAATLTRGRFKKYSQIAVQSGWSGADVARAILANAGLSAVRVIPHEGFLSDHYDPRSRTVRLSPEVYHGRSISAVAVAAHETGHALQHRHAYVPLVVRNAIVPLASIGSNFSFILIFIGMMLAFSQLVIAGIALFSLTVVFQLITLPVEFDASARAKKILIDRGMVAGATERDGVSKVLSAAALTYVAAAVTSISTLLYFLLRSGLLGSRDSRD